MKVEFGRIDSEASKPFQELLLNQGQGHSKRLDPFPKPTLWVRVLSLTQLIFQFIQNNFSLLVILIVLTHVAFEVSSYNIEIFCRSEYVVFLQAILICSVGIFNSSFLLGNFSLASNSVTIVGGWLDHRFVSYSGITLSTINPRLLVHNWSLRRQNDLVLPGPPIPGHPSQYLSLFFLVDRTGVRRVRAFGQTRDRLLSKSPKTKERVSLSEKKLSAQNALRTRRVWVRTARQCFQFIVRVPEFAE